jgi:hypothetical protein
VCCFRYSFCCLNSHHLLQVAAAACGDPEISFANSFRGPLKKCTNRRPFKLAMQHKFSIFHAVGRAAGQPQAREDPTATVVSHSGCGGVPGAVPPLDAESRARASLSLRSCQCKSCDSDSEAPGPAARMIGLWQWIVYRVSPGPVRLGDSDLGSGSRRAAARPGCQPECLG